MNRLYAVFAIVLAAGVIIAAGCVASNPKARAFFGTGGDEDQSKRTFVYMVDLGETSAGDWAPIKKELVRSIGELDDDCDFWIILFQTGRAFSIPEAWPAPATDRYKAAAAEFLGEFTPSGGSDPTMGLGRAFVGRPTFLYWLSTGEVSPAAADAVRRLNVGGRTTVHTLRLRTHAGEDVLKRVAEEGGGYYKFVSAEDLAEWMKQ
jgi:hypothetical protein